MRDLVRASPGGEGSVFQRAVCCGRSTDAGLSSTASSTAYRGSHADRCGPAHRDATCAQGQRPTRESRRTRRSSCSGVLDTAITLTGADFGNVQLVEPATGALRIVTQLGFDTEFPRLLRHSRRCPVDLRASGQDRRTGPCHRHPCRSVIRAAPHNRRGVALPGLPVNPPVHL
jgi:hypothetical protein